MEELKIVFTTKFYLLITSQSTSSTDKSRGKVLFNEIHYLSAFLDKRLLLLIDIANNISAHCAQRREKKSNKNIKIILTDATVKKKCSRKA
jgi:hypothetical protein